MENCLFHEKKIFPTNKTVNIVLQGFLFRSFMLFNFSE
jgi:hypothetical protein